MKNTLCLIVKDESSYILEWIAYHRSIGFDHFCIYDNESSDGTEIILRKLSNAGIIEYRRQDSGEGSPQKKAYSKCIAEYKDKTDLITFIDTDEFICSPGGVDAKAHISNTFDQNPDMTAMALNWRIFGSAGHDTMGAGLVIERFTRAAKNASKTVKTVVRPSCVETMYTHYASLKEGRYGNEVGNPVNFEQPKGTPAPGNISQASTSFLQINHYMVKSRAEFAAKISRGNANYPANHPDKYKRFDEKYFSLYDRNDVFDSSALRHVEKTKSEMLFLLELLGGG